MQCQSETRPQGDVKMKVLRDLGNLALDRYDAPPLERASMWWRLQNLLRRATQGERLPPWAVQFLGKTLGFATLTSALELVHYVPDKKVLRQSERRAKFLDLLKAHVSVQNLVGEFGGRVVEFGVVSRRLITDNGVGFLVDAWQNIVELETMIYHGIGTGTTAANQTDSDIETELTTQYSTDNTRATGSTTEGASANIFRSVGTNTVDASAAVTEHGLLSSATVGAGVLWDRHTFTVINLANGDSLQSTYDMTASAGG